MIQLIRFQEIATGRGAQSSAHFSINCQGYRAPTIEHDLNGLWNDEIARGFSRFYGRYASPQKTDVRWAFSNTRQIEYYLSSWENIRCVMDDARVECVRLVVDPEFVFLAPTQACYVHEYATYAERLTFNALLREREMEYVN